jgi:hypothetical protein
MLGSFALMLPPILLAERFGRAKSVFVGAIALLLAGQLAMPWLLGGVGAISLFLLIFFTAFNILEANLPSLVSKFAPPGAKGTAIGIYSSIQFLGTFVGAASGGYLYQAFGVRGVFAFDALLLVAWIICASGMKEPNRIRTRVYTIPALDREQVRSLVQRLEAQPGVREVQLGAGERTAYLKIDASGFDEQHVLRLIEGEI